MLLPKQRWQIFSPKPDLAEALANATAILPTIAQVLLNRGIDTPEAAKVFLDPELEDLPDPKQEFPDLITSIDRIEQAIKNGDRITICGDYDVDGMTSTALLIRTLRLLGGNVEYEIPSRMIEGYGINARIVQDCHDRDVKLIITVDNGIAAYEAIALAKSLNISIIVTDHHEVPEDPSKIPPATAILNPKYQVDPHSPYAAIAGVGVAYVLALELSDRFGKRAELENPLLELFTLGTIADLASLTGINRRLVKKGLRLLSQSKVIGIIALINETGIAKDKQTGMKPEAIGFGLGPRINAIGRIGNPQVIIDLLTCEDMGQAIILAQECEATNRKRQDLCKDIEQEAIAYMSKLKSEGFDITQERVLVIVDREVKKALTPSPSPKRGEGSKISSKRKKTSSKSSTSLAPLENASPQEEESSNLDPLSPTGRGAGDEGWHHGVIGIVASRLVERYGAPVFIGSYEDAHGEEASKQSATVRFSVRGIPEFHVFHSLEYIANIRNKGGGHKAAGGFTLPAENMDKLRDGLREFADREYILPSHIMPLINIDVLADLSDISMTMLQACDHLQPCGLGNPDPVFYSQNVRVVSQQTRGKDKVKHLSLELDTGNGNIKAIAWRWGEFCPVPDYVDIAYKLRANQWQDTTSVELEVVGIREVSNMENSQSSPHHLQLQYKLAPMITKLPQWQKLNEAPRPLPRPLLLYGCERPADKFQGDVDYDRPNRDRIGRDKDYHAIVLWTLPPSFTHLQWLIATSKPDYIYLGSHIPPVPSIEEFRAQVLSLNLENIEKLNLLDLAQHWWISPSAIISALRELNYICDFPETLPLEGELLRMQKWYGIAIAKLAALFINAR